jgi:SulP family sulfate permease
MKEGICSHFKFLEYLLDIGTDNIFVSKKEAIAEIVARLDKAACAHCRKRIFLECAAMPLERGEGEGLGGASGGRCPGSPL